MKFGKLKFICAILVLVALALTSCSVGADSPHAAGGSGHPQDSRVIEAWKKQERIMEDALAGRTYSIEEFGNACEFFTKLTGIEIRGNGSYFGWLPTQESATDFQRVKDWYAVNRDRLYWDEASGSVKVQPSGKR